jgi:hypothetical protein
VEYGGFQTLQVTNVLVHLGRTTALGDLLLNPAALTETVVVEANRPLIDPRSAAVASTLAAEYFDSLPLARDYRSVAEILPHVNPGTLGDETNYAGSTGLENRFFIDGAEVTDPYRGMGGIHIPTNFVQELEVRIGGYEAEHRGALGGVLNVITPTGTNTMSGDVFGFFASDRFAGSFRQGATDLKRKEYSQWDVGLSLGGPIVRDRVWYFGAYNPNFERLQVEIPGIDWYPEETDRHSFAAKLTWQWTNADQLQVTTAGDPSHRDGVGDLFGNFGTPVSFANPDPYLRRLKTKGIVMSVRGTHIYGSRGLLEMTVSGLAKTFVNVPATPDDRLFVIDGSSGVWSGGSPIAIDNPSRQLTLGAKVTWPIGRHQLKTGGGYRISRQKSDWGGRALVGFGSDFFLLFTSRDNHVVHNRGPSLFIQDEWRVANQLNLNIGVRWDRELLVGSDERRVQHLGDEWQPRIGFVWQPGAAGLQRIFGSAGRFYGEIPLYPASVSLTERQQDFCYYDHDPRIDASGANCVGAGSNALRLVEPGLQGQHFDELTLGYERRLGARHKVGVRGIVRVLREGLESGWSEEENRSVWGNPGRGALSGYPRPRRRYRSFDVTFGRPGATLSYLASYVWSKTVGNYPGVFNSDFEYAVPNANASFDFPEMSVNGDGLLPNDRPHVLKLSGSRHWNAGLALGATFSAASGTPLSEWGGTVRGIPFYGLLRPRGTAGRTPSVTDFSVRLAVDLPFKRVRGTKLIVDGFHLFGSRKPIDYDQIHFFNVDQHGRQTDPNPNYGIPTRYSLPPSLRLGFEIRF